MKQKNFTKCLRHLALLTLMILGIGNAWGTEVTATLTFKKACGGTGTDDKSNSWVITSDAAESTFDDNRGIHYGTGSKAVSYLTLTSSAISGKVSKIVVNASDGKAAAKIDVTVGGVTFGAQSTTLTTANAAYTFEPTAEQSSVNFTGAVVVNISRSSQKKALYCKSIEVTYTTDDSQVVKPSFSVNSQQFFDPFTVSISSATDGASIYYTLDGTDPTTESAVYSTPIGISATTTLKAIAAKSGMTTSDVTSATYTLGKIYASLADLVAAGAPTTTGETVRVTLTDETITKKANNGIFLQSGVREVQIYCYNVPDSFAVGGTVSGTLTCPWKLFNTTWELCPSDWNDLTYKASTKTVATINLSTYQSQLTVGGEDKINVTYNGDGTLSATSSAEGVATVSFSTMDSVLTVTALAAGTTTIIVSAPETETYTAATKSYTLTVKEPVQTATLPFAFDGGRDDIETTQGMSQSGLDTDYSAAPKLKFKATGATVIVNFASEAKFLSYTIKGNGFSGGIFDVLESADGTEYTTVQSHTTLAGTAAIEGKTLLSTSRYVKFVYTSKSSGNVALGNINIQETMPDTANMTIAATNKWATFYAPFAVDVPKNVYAYAITVNGSDEAVRTKVGGDKAYTLPAETPVLLYCDDEGGFSKTFFDGQSTGTPVEVSANSLVGSSVALNPIPAPEAGMTNYVLQNGANGIAWYAVVNSNSLPANRAYLSVATNVDVKGCLDDETSIANVDANVDANANVIYNLAGQRVNKLQNGINIINGKKVLK